MRLGRLGTPAGLLVLVVLVLDGLVVLVAGALLVPVVRRFTKTVLVTPPSIALPGPPSIAVPEPPMSSAGAAAPLSNASAALTSWTVSRVVTIGELPTTWTLQSSARLRGWGYEKIWAAGTQIAIAEDHFVVVSWDRYRGDIIGTNVRCVQELFWLLIATEGKDQVSVYAPVLVYSSNASACPDSRQDAERLLADLERRLK